MLAEKYKEELPVLTDVKCQPCVSVIMPFEPKMNSKAAIKHSLKIAADKINRQLHANYAKDIADELSEKLKNVIGHLDFRTHKKSIAIYVSPAVEKVFYLDVNVREKVMVNTSFEIRDIVLNKKTEREFLLLVISGKKEKIYVGNENKLKLIVSNQIVHINRDLPEPVANFTNAATIKEIKLKKFLHYIDTGLPQILKYYPLPLFIMAPKKTMGYFENITKHHKNIIGFVHGNFDDATENELLKALEPELKNWDIARRNYLVSRINIAQDDLKLASGIHNVWLQANRRHKQLLIVEKDFYCPAFVTEKGETIFSNGNQENELIANDAVDEIIEKVLENGGDVEFVDELKDYNRIALIENTNG